MFLVQITGLYVNIPVHTYIFIYEIFSHSPKVSGHMMPLSISDHQSLRFAGPMLLQRYLKWLRDAASECM